LLELQEVVMALQGWPSAGGSVHVPPMALLLGKQSMLFRHRLLTAPEGSQSSPKVAPLVQVGLALP
jgi:hypothetical protein